MGLRTVLLGKIYISLLAATTLLVTAVSIGVPGDAVVVYSAPTLAVVSDDLGKLYHGRLDVRVLGSVLAANLIKSGKTPDLFLTVDWELKHGLNYRSEYIIGVYRLLLVCDDFNTWEDALRRARISLADPNLAPIGYRSLAAIYLLTERAGLDITQEIMESLNIVFHTGESGLLVDVRSFRAGGRFYTRDDLNGAYSLLQNKLVDCTFAHAPFVNQKNLWAKHNVIELPDYASFLKDPPIKITARLESGDLNILRFVAAAYSFTEKGDEILNYLGQVDFSKYQIEKVAEVP